MHRFCGESEAGSGFKLSLRDSGPGDHCSFSGPCSFHCSQLEFTLLATLCLSWCPNSLCSHTSKRHNHLSLRKSQMFSRPPSPTYAQKTGILPALTLKAPARSRSCLEHA